MLLESGTAINNIMPPEWAEKDRTFIQWPCRKELWTIGMNEAKKAYASVANAISEFENVSMLINEEERGEALQLLSSQVELIEIPHDDSWFRDNGPTFVYNNKELRAICWKFNCWGEKFPHSYAKDATAAQSLAEILGVNYYKTDFILEGGSIHVDGQGTLLTTRECLLNKNRNKDLGQSEIEQVLSTYLGVSNFIWLNNGIFGDEDTDGHVDNVACFVNEEIIAIQSCLDANDPNYPRFVENLNILRKSVNSVGRKFEILEIEQPTPKYDKKKRIARSYLNYYPVNGGVILPVFGDDSKKLDSDAIAKLRDYYPNRTIVPLIAGAAIINGGGNIHCITQQMPQKKL